MSFVASSGIVLCLSLVCVVDMRPDTVSGEHVVFVQNSVRVEVEVTYDSAPSATCLCSASASW